MYSWAISLSHAVKCTELGNYTCIECSITRNHNTLVYILMYRPSGAPIYGTRRTYSVIYNAIVFHVFENIGSNVFHKTVYCSWFQVVHSTFFTPSFTTCLCIVSYCHCIFPSNTSPYNNVSNVHTDIECKALFPL